MKRNKRAFALIAAALLAGSLFTASCGEAQEAADEEKSFSEGVDTAIEITGYGQYTGPYGSAFLQEGDRVAVISPSALPSEEQRDAVLTGLEKLGYTPVEGKYVCCEVRTLENCLEDLEWALTDPSIKAVFCVRGGYAASEVMDIIPPDLIGSAGKLIIGYSDITVYHSAWQSAQLPSIHASMSAAFMDFPEKCFEAEQHILKGEIPSYKCAGSKYDKAGTAEGILIGGNLSTLTSVLGTGYDCTKTDQPYILFLEDVNEDMEHLHRYLTVLKHQGILDRASGLIFGEWADTPEYCETYDGRSRGGTFTSVADMISREFLDELDIPVAFGFPAGHGETNYPLLMGESVRLDVAEGSYTLEW